ncbi:glutamate--tRNA ligase [soil metagenome]
MSDIAPAAREIRSRFAPSPTGYLHLGGARTALFAWAVARHAGGQFILRVEDTDRERSTPEAVQAILDGMRWLGLEFDEGPIYQTERFDRYREVIAQLLAAGSAYHCWTTPAELDVMREAQRARGEKPRYDGRWRPEPGKALPEPPAGVAPVVRFRNPQDGSVTWDDIVKGPISISNHELDDLVIARADGTPTYNFCVVVDDADMRITHVIRGDDHVNNTPRQINILAALGVPLPQYGHVPMILGPDGEKLSKRHGAVSVMQYDTEGFLPEALINYLARLGWSHGDAEIFTREQLVEWFDVRHLSHSPAQWDPKKLAWLNHHYLREADLERLVALVEPRIVARGGVIAGGPPLAAVVGLVRERADTLEALADQSLMFYVPVAVDPQLKSDNVPAAALPALRDFAAQAASIEWVPTAISDLIKQQLKAHGLKMPQLAVPLRVLVTGRTQTPSVDAVLALVGRDAVVERVTAGLA